MTNTRKKLVRTPLYKQFKDLLRERLRREKQWKPGAKIPAERALADEFKISRVTVAKALSELEAEGFLERRPPEGTFLTGKVATQGIVRLLFYLPVDRGAIYPGYAVVLSMLEEALAKAGYALLFTTRLTPEPIKSNATVLVGAFADDAIRQLTTRQPLVLVDAGRHVPGLDGVEIDNGAGADQAVAWLARRGHKRIAYLGGFRRPGEPWPNSEARRAGYRRGLQAAGLPLAPELERLNWSSFPEGCEVMRSLLGSASPPTAVVAFSRDLGAGALAAAHESGLGAPRFEVISFGDEGDDLPDAAGHSGLVRVSWSEMGRTAASLLLERLAGRAGRTVHTLITPRLGLTLPRVGSLFAEP